jgi:hypothetical protein
LNINDLTIGQAKELSAMFGAQANPQPSANSGYNIASPLVGKYVIARCYSAGVHAGIVESVDGENVMLRDSRRLWSWKAQDGIALSGVAQHGVKSDNCKIDVINPLIYLTGVCELIPTTEKAKDSIHGYK